MKLITGPQRVDLSTNCGGRMEAFMQSVYQIEADDVGRKHPNYLGYGHASYTFTRADIGRAILVTTQGMYCNWTFTVTA